MEPIVIAIADTHCRSCELRLEKRIREIPGVQDVRVHSATGKAHIWSNGKHPVLAEAEAAIRGLGYTLGNKTRPPWFSHDWHQYAYLASAVAVVGAIYVLASRLKLSALSGNISHIGIALAVTLGLIAGVSTCIALVGGLVLSLAARHAELHPEASALEKFRPHLFFNLGRILGFAILGALITLLGSILQPSARIMSLATIAVSLVMITLGIKLIGIFPRLRQATFALPKSIATFLGIHKENREYSHVSACISGALTFFLPCGFTQAMQLYAISTGDPWQGAAIMSLFALGTAVSLLGIGGLSSLVTGRVARIFFAVAGVAVIAMGIWNISAASRIAFAAYAGDSFATPHVTTLTATYRTATGMLPNQFQVPAGTRVRLKITSFDDDYGCMGSVLIPGLFDTVQFLRKNRTIVLEFTPKSTGSYPITCAMGLTHGTLRIE